MFTKVKSLLRIVLVGAVAITGLSLTPTSGWAQQGGCDLWGSENAIRALANELFTGWNDALQKIEEPDRVVERYAPNSVLLPTVSDMPRVTAEEKKDYFEHFQQTKPSGEISPVSFPVIRKVFCDNNTLIDAGLYTFTYRDPLPGKPLYTRARYSFTYNFDGQRWLITSHHSSAMPETEVLCDGNPADCPSSCGVPFSSAAQFSWYSWGVWSGNQTGACECFRTAKVAGNMAPTCKNLPTKP